MTTNVVAWTGSRTPRRFAGRSFPPALAARLRGALVEEHAREPFVLRDPRGAARRVTEVLHVLQIESTVVRGGLDIGGAELDHVWTVAGDRVIDVVVPVRSPSFLAALRAYVAGDLEPDEIERAAHGHAMDMRVIGEFPDEVRYVGLPVWGSTPPVRDVSPAAPNARTDATNPEPDSAT